ncbi:FUSC family protein [Lewinella sp. IMCC34183]|uniref:FUSC family protein n=1 Tax=Lewinella sp. IMCC34183 TaxID=2248762 RepID=UPI000E281461|nr:FUSC family protein [Lewinella sp. IMCC34183]
MARDWNWIPTRRRWLGFVQDYGFTRGLLIVVSIISVLVACGYLADLPTGVSCAVGIFLVSICDLPGNKADHLKNMVIGLLLAVSNLIIIQYSLTLGAANLVVLPVLVFLTSYVSVLGKRASLVSFSGLLALVLAYAFPKTGWAIVQSGGFVFLGGAWFILLNVAVHPYRYRRYRLGLLNRGLRLTADYLQLKARQVTADRPDDLWPELIRTHNEINEIRKVLTDYFLGQYPGRDNMGRQSREGVLYLELVDLVELGAAVPVRPEARAAGVADTTHALAAILTDAAGALRDVARKSRHFRSATPEALQERLANVHRHLRAAAPELRAGEIHCAYILYDNVEKQLTKIRSIEALADSREPVGHPLFSREAKRRLRPPAPLNVAALRENLSPDSAVFRHCVRLSVVVLLGYFLGQALGVHNAYWILLTAVVILRPTYVQSKERSVQRTVGTVAGALVAAGVVTLTDNHVVYAILGASAMPFVFIFLDRDYRLAAFFVTLNLVFTYALLHPDAYTVIGYRVIDTVIGAGLAFAASRLLWPAWEGRSIRGLVAKALEGSSTYLREESNYVNQREDDLAYRIARRDAFVRLGELDASYGRTLKEPGMAPPVRDLLKRVVVQNHQVLSAIAYLGTYLQYHAVSLAREPFSILVRDLADRLLDGHDRLTGTGESRAAIDTADALAYFRSAPVVEVPVEQLQQKRLFLEEYTYLSGLVSELSGTVDAYAKH